jgi:hypothetical protein
VLTWVSFASSETTSIGWFRCSRVSVIDDILRADLDAPRKQRHTVKRIYDRLIAEGDMHEVSYAVVRAYVADRKPEIRVEAGRGRSTCSSRRHTGPARRPRSTSARSPSICAANW